MITVGTGAELGLDGDWLTICEDHGMIVSHPTRRLAERHRSDPLGWCEVCMKLNETRGAVVEIAQQIEADKVETVGEQVEREAVYGILHIDSLQADVATLERNRRKRDTGNGHCIICEAPIKNRDRAKEVHLCNGGFSITSLDAPYEGPGDMGIHLIGPECYRKHRDVLAPFVENAS